MSKTKLHFNLAIYTLAFANFVAGISSLIVAGISTEMAEDVGVSILDIGMLISAFAVTYAICSPLISVISGKTDRRILLLLGMLFVLIGNLIVGIAPTYSIAMTGRIISALGTAAFVPQAAIVGISMGSESNKGRITAIVFSGAAMATALGVPFGTYIGINFNWRYSFLGVAILATISILLIGIFIPRRFKAPTASLKTFKKVFEDPLLPIFLLVTILQFGGQMVLFAFISPWLLKTTNLGPMGITMLLLLAGVGGILGNIVAGRATDRFGSRGTQLVLIILLILIMPMLDLITENVFVGGFLIFLWGLVGQGFVAPQLVRIVSANPPLSNASVSLNASFINIGVSLGAFIGGVFVAQIGVEYLTWMATAVVTVSLLVFWMSWRIEDALYKKKDIVCASSKSQDHR